MLRISVTTLESFRRLIRTEYGSEAELIASIKGQPFEPSWQMNAGRAWDDALWLPADETREVAGTSFGRWGKYWFNLAAVQYANKLLGLGVWQIKEVEVMHVGGRRLPVQVVAHADHVRGLEITDNKARFGTVDLSSYEHSLQWRFYLHIHQAASFRYAVWHFFDPDGGNYCDLKESMTVRFWNYPAMAEDCHRWLIEFLAWADDKDLFVYLDREGTHEPLPEPTDRPLLGQSYAGPG